MKGNRGSGSLFVYLMLSALLIVTMSTPAAAAISFTGAVSTSAGAPISGATIEMVGDPSIFTTSAIDGSFTLTGLPEGTTFSVKFSNTGYAPSYTHNFNMTTNFTRTSAYALYTPAEMSYWGITPGKGAISKRATDNTDSTLAGAVVTAASALHPSTPYRVVYTDLQGKIGGSSTFADGIYIVLNIDDGDTVTVTASKAGWSFNSRTFIAHADGVSQGRLVGSSVAPADFPIAATAVREMALGKAAAFDGTNYLVGIEGYDGNPSEVTAQLVSPNGALVGGRIDVGWNGGTPQVAFDGANYLLAWDGCPDNSECEGEGYVISGQLVSKGGALIGSPFRISQTPGHAMSGLRIMAFDGANYFVAWDVSPTDNGCTDEYGQFVTPSGTLLGSSIKINSIPCGGGGVTLEFDGTNILAAWLSEWDTPATRSSCASPNTGPCDVANIWGRFISKSSAGTPGALSGDNFRIIGGSVPIYYSSLGFDGTNYLLLFPQETTRPDACPPGGCEWNVYGQLVSKAGTPAGSLITISNAPGDQFFATSAFDGSNYLITWSDGLGGPSSGVAAKGRFMNPAGSFTSPEFTLFAATTDGRVPFFTGIGGFNNGKYFVFTNWGTPGIDPMNFDAYTDADVYGGFISPRASKVPSDFDGDGKADIAVYRPSSGVWYLLQSGDAYDPTKYKAYLWGISTDIPVPGDYDGDGLADIAVRRPSTGIWYILQSSDGYDQAKYKEYAWGNATDNVVAGDFDGDGKTDIAFYRPSSGIWYILQSSDGYDPNLYKAYLWGNATDIPVSGDFDGDGKTDIAVYRRSDGVWYILQSSDGYSPVLYKSYKWGGDPDDVPVPGDYDGDGKTDIAIYRPSSGVWYILQSSDGYAQSLYKAYLWGGDAGDTPVPGDYDGDGRTDIVLYRPSSGVWYLLLSTDGYDQLLYKAYLWGVSTDKPVSSSK